MSRNIIASNTMRPLRVNNVIFSGELKEVLECSTFIFVNFNTKGLKIFVCNYYLLYYT